MPLDYFNPRNHGTRRGGPDRSPVVFFLCVGLGVLVMAVTSQLGHDAFVVGTLAAAVLGLFGFVWAIVTGRDA